MCIDISIITIPTTPTGFLYTPKNLKRHVVESDMKIKIKYPVLVATDVLMKYSEHDQPYMDEDGFFLCNDEGHDYLFISIVQDNLRRLTDSGRLWLI